MNENEYARRIINTDPDSQRDYGKSRIRWMTGVKEDVRGLVCSKRSLMAQDTNGL